MDKLENENLLKAYQNAESKYSTQMRWFVKRISESRCYVSLAVFYELHIEAKKLCLEFFNEFDDKSSKDYRKKLGRYCDKEFYKFAIQNKNNDSLG